MKESSKLFSYLSVKTHQTYALTNDFVKITFKTALDINMFCCYYQIQTFGVLSEYVKLS